MNKKLRRVLTKRNKEVDLECLNCEKRFTISLSAYNAGQGFFHNRECNTEFKKQQKQIKATQTINRVEFPKNEEGSIKRLIKRAGELRDSIENTIPKEAPKTREVKT